MQTPSPHRFGDTRGGYTEVNPRRRYNLDAVHPGVERIMVSAKTGEGIEEWRDWLVRVGSPVEAPA